MKRLALIVLVVVFTFMVLGYLQSKTISTNVIKLGSSDSGRTIQMGMGQKLAMILPSSISTGCMWKLEDEEILLILDKVEVEFESGSYFLGSEGRTTFKFKAIGLGSVELNLVYGRSWEEKLIRRYSITVQVLSKLKYKGGKSND